MEVLKMNEKQINKYLRRDLRTPGWLLVAYFVLMNLMVMVAMLGDMLMQTLDALTRGEFLTEPDMDAMLGNAWGYFWAVAVAMVILFAWKDRCFWKEQVFVRKKKMRFGTFLVLLCVCMAIQFVNGFWISGLEWVMNQFDRSILETLESVSGSSDTFSMFLYASILAPISEELIFRGYIQGSLSRYGKKFSILCSALLFGIFHGNLVQTPYAFFAGLLLGYVAAQYHIGWAIGIHFFNNCVLADLLTRATSGLSEEVASAINMILLGLATVVTGIMLIVKRKAIAAYGREEWLDRRCLKWFLLNSGTIVLFILMSINSLVILMA